MAKGERLPPKLLSSLTYKKEKKTKLDYSCHFFYMLVYRLV